MIMAEEKQKYIETIGRRKTAIARVRITPGLKGSISINGEDLDKYFSTDETRRIAVEALTHSKLTGKFKITAKVSGGGQSGQADAVRHGIARALVIFDKELRTKIKHAGFLKRDPRAKERRKFGLKKARKAQQWSKR